MVTSIKELKDLTRIPGTVKPDSRKRVILPNNLVREGVIYHMYSNELGQILLDPQVTIPASELWLFNNPEALASVRRGLDDAAAGRVSRVDMGTL